MFRRAVASAASAHGVSQCVNGVHEPQNTLLRRQPLIAWFGFGLCRQMLAVGFEETVDVAGELRADTARRSKTGNTDSRC